MSLTKLLFLMDKDNPNFESSRMLRPWWKEPMAIAFGVMILAASVMVMSHGWTPPAADPVGRTVPVPGGGSFCDPATPMQGTLENPSTQTKEDELRTSNVQNPTSK